MGFRVALNWTESCPFPDRHVRRWRARILDWTLWAFANGFWSVREGDACIFDVVAKGRAEKPTLEEAQLFAEDWVRRKLLTELSTLNRFDRELDILPEKPRKPDQLRVIELTDFDRAAGDTICNGCGFAFYDHDTVRGYRWLTRLCNGRLVKL